MTANVTITTARRADVSASPSARSAPPRGNDRAAQRAQRSRARLDGLRPRAGQPKPVPVKIGIRDNQHAESRAATSRSAEASSASSATRMPQPTTRPPTFGGGRRF